MTTSSNSPLLRKGLAPFLLLLLMGWYGLGTLPYLGDFPLLGWAQMGIVAPAHQLATDGVYGNDLFKGFYRNERYNYEYMPLYPLLVALSFKGFGLGIWQARMVSVLAGLAVVLLTYLLGRQLYDKTVGLLAALVLCVARLGVGVAPYHTGIPLIDLARVIRYDVLVPVWVLAACCLFLWSCRKESRPGYVGTGVLAGLATLTHLYGAFILAVFGCVLLWRRGGGVLRTAPLYLMLAGWMLALVPWILYVLQDVAAYRGQMLRHGARFALLDPVFYVRNLLREVYRYTHWVGPSLRAPVVWPRLGIWVTALGVPWALGLLWRRARRHHRLPDQLLVVALPLLSVLLALLISFKRYPYLALTLPFIALYVAVGLVHVWRGAGQRARYVRAGLGILLIGLVAEGGTGIWQSRRQARTTTPYQHITMALREAIPADTRVLISQPYWLALADYETRSINLAFVLSDPKHRLRPTPTMQEALQDIDLDYIVVEKYFLEDYADDPARLPGPQAQWRSFADYVRQHCPGLVTAIKTPDYGEIRVYRCE